MTFRSGATAGAWVSLFLGICTKKRVVVRAFMAATLFLVAGLFQPYPGASQASSKTLVGIGRDTQLRFSPLTNFEPLFRAESDTGLVAPFCSLDLSAENGEVYVYESPPKQAPHPFNALGFHWEGDLPPGTRLTIDARTSHEGALWTAWLPTEEVDALRGTGSRDTDLLFSPGQFLQYRIALASVPAHWVPTLQEVKVTYIDSRQGPSAWEAAAVAGPSRRLSALTRPNVIDRAAWGANEGHRFYQGAVKWPPSYAPVQKIILHHTATSNQPVDSAAAARAIYYYHAVTLGWGDIGYNYLMDSEGRVYEGRFGGPSVVGGHAIQYNAGSIGIGLLGTFATVNPSEKALTALEAFLIAKAVQHGIDAKGKGFFVDKELPNILGHRDALNTSCPGDRLWGQLPSFRVKVVAGLPPYGEAWLNDQTPKVVKPGDQMAVSLTLRNSGTAIWTTIAPTSTRLGYRWYFPDGTPLPDAPSLAYHSDLPQAVNPGESVTVKALLRTPNQPGKYLLKWDMVQERVTWFMDQGNVPLERAVTVMPDPSLPNEVLIGFPSELLVALPPERLRSLPLSRLTLLANAELVELLPEVIPLLSNERVASFSNDILLRYLSDARLKTFSMERIRTFPIEVQRRLGFAPPPPADPGGAVAP